MFRFKYSIQNTKNNVLTSQKSMPLKDSTTTGDSDFSIPRHQYIETNSSVTIPEKKWMGGNRDASQVIQNRRIHSVGLGSLNATRVPSSFTSSIPTNTVRQAKHRVRSGGANVPAKVTHKYNNAPVFY